MTEIPPPTGAPSLPSNATAIPEPPASPQPPRRSGSETILTLVSGVLAGVGGVFAGTHSVLITIIAAVAAVALAAMVLHTQR